MHTVLALSGCLSKCHTKTSLLSECVATMLGFSGTSLILFTCSDAWSPQKGYCLRLSLIYHAISRQLLFVMQQRSGISCWTLLSFKKINVAYLALMKNSLEGWLHEWAFAILMKASNGICCSNSGLQICSWWQSYSELLKLVHQHLALELLFQTG